MNGKVVKGDTQIHFEKFGMTENGWSRQLLRTFLKLLNAAKTYRFCWTRIVDFVAYLNTSLFAYITDTNLTNIFASDNQERFLVPW